MMKSLVTMLTLVMGLAFSAQAFATASSVVQTTYTKVLDHGKPVRVVKLVVTASSVDGSVTDVSVPGLHGFLMKAITAPAATNPTTLYDISLLDPDGSLDALNSTLQNRSASAAEQVFPVGATGASPLWLAPGNYTLHIVNNSVNSAGVTIWLYFVDSDARAF
jgi:hypothetical protein